MVPLERLWLRQMRSCLLPLARGRVLEVGIGTGANLRFYSQTVCLTGIDESSDMLAVAARRAGALDAQVHLCRMDVEHLAFASDWFDTVVASLVLCSVVDQIRALRELSRVLRKPGGELLLLEHMRPEFKPWAWLVDLLNIPWYSFNGRCHLNRRTEKAIVESGFRVKMAERKAGGLFRLIVAQLA
jgi:ubiquinone/menaquinone biosynthesis C-methylase UbiE